MLNSSFPSKIGFTVFYCSETFLRQGIPQTHIFHIHRNFWWVVLCIFWTNTLAFYLTRFYMKPLQFLILTVWKTVFLFFLFSSSNDVKIADSSQGLIVGVGGIGGGWGGWVNLPLLNHRNLLFMWKLCNYFHYDLQTALGICKLSI